MNHKQGSEPLTLAGVSYGDASGRFLRGWTMEQHDNIIKMALAAATALHFLLEVESAVADLGAVVTIDYITGLGRLLASD